MTTRKLVASAEGHAVSCVIKDFGSASSFAPGDSRAFSEVIVSGGFWCLIERDLVIVKQKLMNCCEKMIASSEQRAWAFPLL